MFSCIPAHERQERYSHGLLTRVSISDYVTEQGDGDTQSLGSSLGHPMMHPQCLGAHLQAWPV